MNFNYKTCTTMYSGSASISTQIHIKLIVKLQRFYHPPSFTIWSDMCDIHIYVYQIVLYSLPYHLMNNTFIMPKSSNFVRI